MSKHDDLVKDWPSDPANDELVQLAEELASAAPALPPAALARVAEQMRAEIARGERRQRWRRVAFGLSIAAAILIAIGTFSFMRRGDPDELARKELKAAITRAEEFRRASAGQRRLESVPIVEEVAIAVGEGAPAPKTDKSLVQLDKYSSLFSD